MKPLLPKTNKENYIQILCKVCEPKQPRFPFLHILGHQKMFSVDLSLLCRNYMDMSFVMQKLYRPVFYYAEIIGTRVLLCRYYMQFPNASTTDETKNKHQ